MTNAWWPLDRMSHHILLALNLKLNAGLLRDGYSIMRGDLKLLISCQHHERERSLKRSYGVRKENPSIYSLVQRTGIEVSGRYMR